MAACQVLVSEYERAPTAAARQRLAATQCYHNLEHPSKHITTGAYTQAGSTAKLAFMKSSPFMVTAFSFASSYYIK